MMKSSGAPLTQAGASQVHVLGAKLKGKGKASLFGSLLGIIPGSSAKAQKRFGALLGHLRSQSQSMGPKANLKASIAGKKAGLKTLPQPGEHDVDVAAQLQQLGKAGPLLKQSVFEEKPDMPEGKVGAHTDGLQRTRANRANSQKSKDRVGLSAASTRLNPVSKDHSSEVNVAKAGNSEVEALVLEEPSKAAQKPASGQHKPNNQIQPSVPEPSKVSSKGEGSKQAALAVPGQEEVGKETPGIPVPIQADKDDIVSWKNGSPVAGKVVTKGVSKIQQQAKDNPMIVSPGKASTAQKNVAADRSSQLAARGTSNATEQTSAKPDMLEDGKKPARLPDEVISKAETARPKVKPARISSDKPISRPVGEMSQPLKGVETPEGSGKADYIRAAQVESERNQEKLVHSSPAKRRQVRVVQNQEGPPAPAGHNRSASRTQTSPRFSQQGFGQAGDQAANMARMNDGKPAQSLTLSGLEEGAASFDEVATDQAGQSRPAGSPAGMIRQSHEGMPVITSTHQVSSPQAGTGPAETANYVARMTVLQYTRFVSGERPGSVFQFDGGHLGQVQVTFSESGSGTAVHIVVDSPEAHQMLQRSLPHLEQSWNQQGLTFEKVNVEVGQQQEQSSSRSGGNLTGQNHEGALEVPLEVLSEQAKRYGYNTVEFIA